MCLVLNRLQNSVKTLYSLSLCRLISTFILRKIFNQIWSVLKYICIQLKSATEHIYRDKHSRFLVHKYNAVHKYRSVVYL